ncbi:MAG: glycosyltransferase, partial [Alistipes ihumii]|nr:glycosyltransferase [Alistipes ihumii]
YAGVTNKLLASRARRICVAYEGMERFFPADRIVLTGNPLRGRFAASGDAAALKAEALAHFGLEAGKPVVLVVGGSLGTRTLNEAMKAHADEIVREGRFQVIWQTGKYYEREMDEFMRGRDARGIWRGAFIERMDLAYAAADVVVARSGAGTVSELCLVGKAVVFVPSPNVAEDHQTKNAMALADRGGALVVPDREAVARVFSEVGRLLADDAVRSEMEKNIRALAVADSADRVADEILKVVKRSE